MTLITGGERRRRWSDEDRVWSLDCHKRDDAAIRPFLDDKPYKLTAPIIQ
jgi:hypothetical protein